MKKILLILCLLLPNYVLAYENNFFEVDIPKEYNDVVESDGLYTWNNTSETNLPKIVITVENNNLTTPQNIDEFNEDDLLEYKKTIKSTLDSNLKEYNLSIEVSDIKKNKINKYNMLTYTTIWPTKDTYSYDLYQKSYVITTKKYITTLIYTTSNEEDQNNDEIKNVLNSLVINDNLIVKKVFFTQRRNQILVVGVTAGIIGFIISALSKKKRKSN